MPFSLRLFGAPGVDGPDGPLGGRIAQRHPLALLAVLAAAPSATVSREKLLGLLWPDSDTDRARGLLNVAVHAIRKALGEGAIVSVGGSLQLDRASVRSDVRAFADALAQGEPERAVEVYAGPFLDGFYLDAEAFDGWAEGERARLAGALAEALERLADAAGRAGDPVRAAAWWKRRAGHDPCDSRVALRLMEALSAAGDRAGALQHARVHEAMVRATLDAPPDPAIAALAGRLRSAPAAAAPPPTSAEPAAATGVAEAPSPVPKRLRRRRPAGAAAGVLAVATAAALYLGATGRPGAPRADPGTTAVAVLPFADRSPHGDQAYLADGISEEILTALARLPGMRVPARTSAFAFRAREMDVREIGRRLGVRYVLEGSVGTSADRLRVNASLVSVDNGYRVWSGTFDRGIDSAFAVQDEIARAVVARLRPHADDAPPPPGARRAVNPESYRLFLQAREAWSSRTGEGLARGLYLLEQSIARDPSNARAHAGRAECFALLVTYGVLSPQEGYSRARPAAERALALDSTLAEAHASLALVQLYYDRDWRGAGLSFERALRLNPGYATARQRYATYLAYQRRFGEALAAVEAAQRLDPFSAPALTAEGAILYYAHRYDEALERFRAALTVDPGFWPAYLRLAQTHAQQGRYGEALAEAERARRLAHGQPIAEALRGYVLALSGRRDEARAVIRGLAEQGSRRYVSPAYAAAIHAALGEPDSATAQLERAFATHDDWVVYLPVEPVFDPLRSDPAFARLVARVEAGE
ncbi:tetratricopeptide repeat protein [Longimicrobium sp.]|uniref:tetratricopeptide repeat protein n=1 Tax=Longimicrobium sp. TaxID=2029185 RepID=UPI002B5CD9A7|nr:tetratricopeptide repeat protein [Longimicrobium sp.]HSU14159.1 tetratricopeptide repeat protein [Longimicrobium sp.]